MMKRSDSRTKSGDITSASSMSMEQLKGLPGYKLLTYIKSNQFGQYGESNKLVDII